MTCVDILIVDHNYIAHFDSLSPFVNNIIVYTAGFFVRALTKKTHCDTCRASLMSSTIEDDVYCIGIALMQFKNWGGLVVPSLDVVAVCKTTERKH